MGVGVILALVVLTGQSWPARVVAQEEKPPLIVRELALQGNRRVQEAVIWQRVQTRVGFPFSSARLAEDVRRVFALGFFDDVQVKVEEFEGGIKLTFVVVERPFVRDIDFTGNRRIATRDLQALIGFKLGTLYNPVDVQRAREKLKAHYEAEGLLEAEIAPATEKLPDGDLKVVFRIAEGGRFTIDRIVIQGARGLSERQVKAVMQTRERRFLVFRGILQRERLEEDLERIAALYQDHGYIRARVEGHEISLDRARGRVTIAIRVVEGPQFTVGRMVAAGTSVLPLEEARRQIRLVPGEVFSRSKLRESVQGILALYGAVGRACAEVNVTLEVTAGSEVSVERIGSPARC